jgi:hypothetical protein
MNTEHFLQHRTLAPGIVHFEIRRAQVLPCLGFGPQFDIESKT